MRIGIDFDNTIADTWDVIKHLCPHRNNYYELTKDEDMDIALNHLNDLTMNTKLISGVKKAFDFLHSSNVEIFLITARGIANPEIINVTKKYLENHDIYFDYYIFREDKKSKVCIENKIDLLIDDNEKVIDEVASHGIDVLKFGSSSIKYDFVLSWDEAVKYIKERMIK